MFRFAARSNESRLLSVATRHEIAIASVVGAFVAVFFLQRFGVGDPFALILLAAIAISFSCGGTGPGILGIILSLIGLNAFLHFPNGWFHIALI